MNNRLQEKIDEIKKTLKPEEFHSLLCFDQNPPKFEPEMPPAYQHDAANLLEIIKERESLVKDLPNILPSQTAQARKLVSEMDQEIEKIESELDKFYREHQQKAQFKQEVYEATILQDYITEEHFIRVKHLKPHIFERFKDYVYEGMTDEEIAEQEAIIAKREANELEAILAADTDEPEFNNPHLKRLSSFDLFAGKLLELSFTVFETDDYFKETYETIQKGKGNRIDYAHRMNSALPVYRRRLDETIRKIEPAVRRTTNHLQNYFNERRANGTFVEKPDVTRETLDKLFAELEKYRIETYIAYKHLQPKKFRAYHDIATKGYTPAELREFKAKVAKREAESLKIILKSVKNEIH